MCVDTYLVSILEEYRWTLLRGLLTPNSRNTVGIAELELSRLVKLGRQHGMGVQDSRHPRASSDYLHKSLREQLNPGLLAAAIFRSRVKNGLGGYDL